MKYWIVFCALLGLVGCAPQNQNFTLNQSYSARGQSSRVEFIVIHYTAGDFKTSLETLTKTEVSAHYLIPPEGGTVYQLVDENRRAWHAGDSQWRGRTWLNSSSIGIELVNSGYEDTPEGRKWFPYSDAQINTLIALLKELKQRHNVHVGNIVGHSDIAPQRKVDPGPTFPWARLAAEGVAAWPDARRVQELYQGFNQQLPPPSWFQSQLSKVGYAIPQSGQWDEASRTALIAFQMKYRPDRYDGEPDLHSAALLSALLEAFSQP